MEIRDLNQRQQVIIQDTLAATLFILTHNQFYTQPDDRQFCTDEADSCTNVLKRKAEMTQEDETMEDIVYVDNILPASMQCMSSDENKSLLNKKSNMTSCATPSISTSSVPIIKVQAPKKYQPLNLKHH
ncbi:uncharacterized protein [Polyergus mexicanus]|uniref:uncharacterized protein isoform X2 n=1 Tax=Polyergus mexicanus TaxID=615972 RepID=UPI0038B63A6F